MNHQPMSHPKPHPVAVPPPAPKPQTDRRVIPDLPPIEPVEYEIPILAELVEGMTRLNQAERNRALVYLTNRFGDEQQ